MRIVYSIGRRTAVAGPSTIIISACDGVHRGQVNVLHQASALARSMGESFVVALPWLDGAAGELLTLLDERLSLLDGLGSVDVALVLSRPPDSGAFHANDIIDAICGHVAARRVFIEHAGDDQVEDAHDNQEFIYDSQAIGRYAVQRGLKVEVAKQDDESERSSAGAVMRCLRAGDVSAAAQMLGRPYSVQGVVMSGDRRGRLLGFPTANLRLDARKALPADGIYAVYARLPGEMRATHPALVSLGVRPQFGDANPRLVEVYILDAALDLYGLTIGVDFIARLRGEQRFPDVEALKAQMAQDVLDGRRALAAAPAILP